MKKYLPLILAVSLFSCNSKPQTTNLKPTIGFLDFVEDATLAKARTGFFDALEKNGFSEKDCTLIVYKSNANGDIPTLNQSCDYLLSKNVDVLATNTTLATITAVQKTKTLPAGKAGVPVCMMVAPRPDIAKLTDANGNAPANLFGVYETLEYIDSAVTLIKTFFPDAKVVGTIYNQAEPQSRDAFSRLEKKANELGLAIISLPVSNSSETQLVTQSLLQKKPDVFFALPDNVIFGSFETVVQSCNAAHVPIFTSEAGLVARGALASYGADFYQWGFQAGEQAATFLKTKSMQNIKPEMVLVRKKIYNVEVAKNFGVMADSSFNFHK